VEAILATVDSDIPGGTNAVSLDGCEAPDMVDPAPVSGCVTPAVEVVLAAVDSDIPGGTNAV
jgi:hypothetical protein